MMKQLRYYKVAGLTFGIVLPEGIELQGGLEAYEPFAASEADDRLFLLPILPSQEAAPTGIDDWEKLTNSDLEDAVTEVYRDNAHTYHYVLRLAKLADRWMCVDFRQDFSEMCCRVHGDARFLLFALNNALMLLFALCSAPRSTLLFHASVIMHEGKGYLFLGKSGTGKSTHSQLWLRYIEGSELLNDDNPAVRLIDGKPWVFGTPWSGKTPCNKNDQVPIGGFIKLQQAPRNEIEKLSVLQAYAALLSSISIMHWEKTCADAVHATINQLMGQAPVFCLKNRPEKAAAQMSYQALRQADGKN